MYVNGAEQQEADTPKHDNVMCYPEERQNEQKTISLGIQWNQQRPILAHKSDVSSQNLGNRRLKYTPNAPPVKEPSV